MASSKAARLLPADEVLTAGRLRLDVGAHEVWVSGRRIELAPKEFDLLAALLRRDGVVGRQTLLSEVWGPKHRGAGNTLDVHIRRLRRKVAIAAAGIRLVTVRGTGYRLIAVDREAPGSFTSRPSSRRPPVPSA